MGTFDFQQLWGFDFPLLKFFSGGESYYFDAFVSMLTATPVWGLLYAALFYLVVKNNEKFQQVVLIIFCCTFCLLLSGGLSEWFVKPYFMRLRPVNEPALFGLVHVIRQNADSTYSFFSGHAANTCSVFVFFSLLVRHRIFTLFMLFWTLLVSWTRLYLGMHYPSDVIFGWMWGAMVGSIAYFIWSFVYHRISPRLNYVSTQYTKTGYGLQDIDVVICSMLLTMIAAMIAAAFCAIQ